MNIKELQDYNSWLKTTPDNVFASAKAVGGWKVVFPTRLPVWASKVRNYFNTLPLILKRIPETNAKHLLNRADNLGFLYECHEIQSANEKWQNRKMNPWGGYDPPPFKVPVGCPTTASHATRHMGIKESIAVKNALSGDVYFDDGNRVWYQMAAGSTIYHWGDHPSSPALEAAYQDTIMGQNDTPVFKLVSPDDAGGSSEVIIFNQIVSDGPYNNRGTSIGNVNQRTAVMSITETDSELQGSYNYSETTRVGLAAHDLRDVKPHVTGHFFYVNPPNQYAPLERRTFLPLDLQQKPLADQG
jgi:hypothetical protein